MTKKVMKQGQLGLSWARTGPKTIMQPDNGAKSDQRLQKRICSPRELLFQMLIEAKGGSAAPLESPGWTPGRWVVDNVPARCMQFTCKSHKLCRLLVTQVQELVLYV